jgi:uncharacterized protein (DUF433 family)
MALTFETESVPLAIGHDGVVRVGNTRVTLDSVVSSFSNGGTAEEIVQKYPSLDLADVYEVLSYYLRHTAEVEHYFGERRTASEAARRENESRFDPKGIRGRLLARHKKE